MVNYQNGKIYKVESLIGNCRYIGSTCQKLSMRMASHKRKYREQKQYYSCYEVLKHPDAKIILVEKYACNSREELIAKEAEYIKQLDCVNKRIEGRTIKEWREDNKEKLSKRGKKWRSENKEHIKLQNKKYRETNKEKLKLEKKEYYEKNKEKIKLRAKEKMTCECGSTFRKIEKSRHYKTKKHLKFIEQQ